MRLCSECAILAEDLLLGLYTLRLWPARHEFAQCEGCWKLAYTLKYTPDKYTPEKGGE